MVMSQVFPSETLRCPVPLPPGCHPFRPGRSRAGKPGQKTLEYLQL